MSTGQHPHPPAHPEGNPMTAPEPTMSRWQRFDGWPSYDYFNEVARECERRGIEFDRWFRDADHEADFEVGDMIFRWWVSADADDPTHADDFVPRGPVETGWFWVYRGNATWSDLHYLADPTYVADWIAGLVDPTPKGTR